MKQEKKEEGSSQLKKTRKNTVFLVVLSVFFVMFGLFRASTSQAVVQVLPRLNISGDILKDEGGVDIPLEDLVLLGKFAHGIYNQNSPYNTLYESSATPVLWRVMSGDAAPGSGQRRVTLLTNYMVDARRYNGVSNNTWSGSELQMWLNNDANGFLKNFTSPAQAVLVSPSPDGLVGSKVTLPTFAPENGAIIIGNANHSQYVYSGDMCLWFGDNDFEFDALYNKTKEAPHGDARVAMFKGWKVEYGYTYWLYWTRSPNPYPYAVSAWRVGWYGDLVYGAVTASNVGVRPVCVVDLGSVVFKSGVDNFELSAPSGEPAGAPENPYVLVLSGDIPEGMSVKFASADMPPSDVYIDEKTLTLEWDIAISQAVKKWPDLRDFSLLRADGSRLTPVAISADASPKKLILTFGTAVLKDELVKLDYNLNTDAISFDVTAGTVKVMNSLSNRSVENRTGRVAPPIVNPSSAFTALLNRLNASLAPNKVAVLNPYTCQTGTPIKNTRRAVFALRTEPNHSLAGYTPLASSFAASVDLGEGTVGDALALKFTIDTDGIKGFAKWEPLSESEQIALLNAQHVLFVYEYADGRSTSLVGNGGTLSWERALKEGAVSFIGSKISLNYAIIDSTERAFVCGNALVVPDGEENQKLTGSVWLMQNNSGNGGGGGGGCNSGIGFVPLLLMGCLGWMGLGKRHRA